MPKYHKQQERDDIDLLEVGYRNGATLQVVPDGTEEKTLLSDDPVLDRNTPPRDRYYLVYAIMMLNGIGCLMPWNMFITAFDYFKIHKFGGECSIYSGYFLSYLGICSHVPGITMCIINLVFQVRGGLTKRIMISIAVIILVFVLTTALAIVDSSEWTMTFFVVTMVSVVIMNSCNGIYQNCVYGVAAKLPSQYSNAVLLGNNVSGTMASIIFIVSIAVSPNLRTAAIYYFITAVTFLLICFDSYFVLPRCSFYRYYKSVHKSHQPKPSLDEDKRALLAKEQSFSARLHQGIEPYLRAFKQSWVHLISVWFIFFVTLTIFPQLQANIKPVSPLFKRMGSYFSAVLCFLSFNLMAMFGNLASHWICWPSPRWTWIPVAMRGVFIPLFMLLNYRPGMRSFPVYIESDWAFVAFGILFAFSSGYLSSLVMMYAPRSASPGLAPLAGMLSGCFLVLGVATGAGFSLAMAAVLQGPINNEICAHNTTAPLLDLSGVA